MKNIFVFANTAASVAELTTGAAALGERVTLITSGSTYGCASIVYTYPAELSAVSILPAAAALVAASGAELLICENSSDGASSSAVTAPRSLGASPLCDSQGLDFDGEGLISTRLVYGGSAIKTEKSPLPAVAIMNAGVFDASASSGVPEILELEGSAQDGLELVGTSALETSTVNLAAAKRVVGAGRGLVSADNIPALEKLAEILGAEIGCTRPAAEEENWFPKERYIGVSGCMIMPNFYLAVGISGQIQHMVGVNQANVIFSIDKNENAPIISQSDYSLIGDVGCVLPALIEQLG